MSGFTSKRIVCNIPFVFGEHYERHLRTQCSPKTLIYIIPFRKDICQVLVYHTELLSVNTNIGKGIIGEYNLNISKIG